MKKVSSAAGEELSRSQPNKQAGAPEQNREVSPRPVVCLPVVLVQGSTFRQLSAVQ
jgi:hypothetical protein